MGLHLLHLGQRLRLGQSQPDIGIQPVHSLLRRRAPLQRIGLLDVNFGGGLGRQTLQHLHVLEQRDHLRVTLDHGDPLHGRVQRNIGCYPTHPQAHHHRVAACMAAGQLLALDLKRRQRHPGVPAALCVLAQQRRAAAIHTAAAVVASVQPHAPVQQPPGALLAQLVPGHVPGRLKHWHAQRLRQHMDIHAALGQACAWRGRGGQRLHGL